MKSMAKAPAAAICLLLTVLAISGCQSSQAEVESVPAPATQAVKVSVMTIEPAPIKDVLILPGTTEAIQDVRLAAECDGRVEWIGPKEGDKVKKEEIIAKVDVDALKAVLDRARADYSLKQDLAQRREMLHKRKALPKEELDRALTERMVAEQTLREAQVRYRQGMVRSSLNGVVNHLYVDPGEFVGRGDPVVDIVDVDRIRINLNVPELDIRYIDKGHDALITVDAYPDRKWLGKVDFVAFKADPATKTFKVRIVVDNSDNAIRPGMIARAALMRRYITDALAAPMFSILDKGGERIVFVEKNGVAHARQISIGVMERDRVQITKGLEPGDRLIVSGHDNVEEGMKVEVQ